MVRFPDGAAGDGDDVVVTGVLWVDVVGVLWVNVADACPPVDVVLEVDRRVAGADDRVTGRLDRSVAGWPGAPVVVVPVPPVAAVGVGGWACRPDADPCSVALVDPVDPVDSVDVVSAPS